MSELKLESDSVKYKTQKFNHKRYKRKFFLGPTFVFFTCFCIHNKMKKNFPRAVFQPDEMQVCP